MNCNKNVLITGSSRGIGASVARAIKSQGGHLILHGKTRSRELQSLAEELDAEIIVCDVTNREDVAYEVSKLESVDVLINSAGVNISKEFSELTNEDWRHIYDVNVFGTVNVIREVVPLLNDKDPGRIINIASVKGFYHSVGRVAYASSKAAIINLTAGLAKELAPNILVNCVAPGFTSTDMTEGTWSDRIERQVNSILLQRMAKPTEIANVVAFLSSNECTYITGQTIVVDGGFSIKNE